MMSNEQYFEYFKSIHMNIFIELVLLLLSTTVKGALYNFNIKTAYKYKF